MTGGRPEPAQLKRETYTFAELAAHEVLLEPLYGCWEGNMAHALERRPVDICRLRGEEQVVIGNAGVTRIIGIGSAVTSLAVGDLCMICGVARRDRFGFMKAAPGYDAPGTMGVLAKQTKMHEDDIILLPRETKYSLQQWAAFSLRYITAWANWEMAYGAFRLMLSAAELPAPFVWGWGGGCALAELELAKGFGCRVAMIASQPERLQTLTTLGIEPIDRREFLDLTFDEARYQSDPAYKQHYEAAEARFLSTVKERTQGLGVSIFIDYIGTAVARATLKALGSPGVLTTAGWKSGMKISAMRAIECINWHVHVHTHFARRSHIYDAINYAETHGWMPRLHGKEYAWDEIPELANDYREGKIDSYFPIFQINPV